jgi:hypothetical protein
MWERLVEIVLFCRTGKHRAPGQILKSFIRSKDAEDKTKMTNAEEKKLRAAFAFLDKSYKESNLGKSRLARDLAHFYTMVTALISSDLLQAKGEAPNFLSVRNKLLKFAKLIETPGTADQSISPKLREYMQAASKQTTHPGQREKRQHTMLEIIDKV